MDFLGSEINQNDFAIGIDDYRTSKNNLSLFKIIMIDCSRKDGNTLGIVFKNTSRLSWVNHKNVIVESNFKNNLKTF